MNVSHLASLIVLVFAVFSAAATCLALARAALGYEDEQGFHFGAPVIVRERARRQVRAIALHRVVS